MADLSCGCYCHRPRQPKDRAHDCCATGRTRGAGLLCADADNGEARCERQCEPCYLREAP
jgi:hypothetical protein